MGFLSDLLFTKSKVEWHNATATFTGVCVDQANNIYHLSVPEGVTPFAYEIKYKGFGRGEVTAWHMFLDGSTPDPGKLAGTTMEIRFRQDDPQIFEPV